MLLSHFSRVRLCATPQRAAHQAPPSLGFSRQEYWSGLPFPSPMHESEKSKWSCSVVSDSSQPHGLQNPRNSPGQNTGVGNLSLLQGIIPTQGSNPGLPHCRCILYQPSHKGISNTENSRNFSGEILLYFMMILNTNGEVSWWLWKPIFRNLTSNIVLEQHCILSVLAPH